MFGMDELMEVLRDILEELKKISTALEEIKKNLPAVEKKPAGKKQ